MATPSYPSFITIADVVALTGQSPSHCGKIIRQLNEELQAKDYITFRGRVSTEYYCQRAGIDPETIPGSLRKPKPRATKKRGERKTA